MNRLFGYLSFQGRTNRARYWLTNLAIFGSTFVCVILASSVMAILPPLALVMMLLLLPIFVAALANGARRLHDRGKSAWWLIVFAGIPALLSALRELMTLGGGADAEGPAALLALISLPFSIWALVELGFLKGVAGPNRFGEDPLAPPPEQAIA
jgi:uncharacterized membrane protein YhaH (DUF805 family)